MYYILYIHNICYHEIMIVVTVLWGNGTCSLIPRLLKLGGDEGQKEPGKDYMCMPSYPCIQCVSKLGCIHPLTYNVCISLCTLKLLRQQSSWQW